MVVVLVRLRLAIQRHRGGRSPVTRALTLWGRWLAALVLGIALGAAVRLVDTAGDSGDLGVLVVLTVVFVGWVALPVVVPGMGDTTVDPARLEQFPLSPIAQVVGLLLGGLLAPTALLTFLAATGGAALPGEHWWVRLAAVAVAAVFAAICVAASRAVVATLGSAVRTRHGQDIVYVALGVVSLVLLLLTRSPTRLSSLLEDDAVTITSVLAWTPPGAIGQVLIALRDGEFVAAITFVVVALGWMGAFVAAWTWAIRRRVDGSGTRSRGNRRRHGRPANLALTGPLSGLGTSPATAAAAQHLRYLFARSTKAAQTLVIGVMMGVFVGHSTVASSGLVIGTAMFVPLVALQAGSNLFGYDDRGFGWLFQTGAPLRAVVVGKAAVAAAITALGALVFVLAESAITNHWDQATPAVLVGLAATGWAIGVGSLTSVRLPFNQEHPSGSRLRLAGSSMGAVIAMFLGIFGGGWAIDQLVQPVATLPGALVAATLGLLAGGALVTLSGRRAAVHPDRIASALGV